MTKLFSDFNGLETFFLLFAIIGGFFVILKLILQFIGGDDGSHDSFSGDAGADGSHADSDLGFRMLSLHGLSAFFMMFGLVGLALYRQSETGVIISIVGASIAGMLSMWVIDRKAKQMPYCSNIRLKRKVSARCRRARRLAT